MTPSRSMKTALFKSDNLPAYRKHGLRFGQSRLIEVVAKRLGPRVVFGGPDVDEHSLLFEGVYPVLEQTGKYILLEAGRSIRNMLPDGALKHVNTTVHDVRDWDPHLFTKSINPIVIAQLNSSVSRRIRNSAYGHTGQPAMLLMKTNQLAKIELKKRVAIHY